jgi:hypothetical protein
MVLEALEVIIGIIKRLLSRPSAVPTEPKISIVQISDPGTIECSDAINLYKSRFRNPNLRATEKDMLRWIADDYRHRHNPIWPRDVLLAAIHHDKVCGLINFTYYPTARLAFISYLAAAKPQSGLGQVISRSLVGGARSFLESRLIRCSGIVAEVDSPFHTADIRERNERCSRLKRFHELAEINGMILVNIGIDYTAPKTHLDGEAAETPMLLLYSRLGRKPVNGFISKREAKRILGFVFRQLYADSFVHDPKIDQEYRTYMNSLFEQHLAQIRHRSKVPAADLKSIISKIDEARLHPESCPVLTA